MRSILSGKSLEIQGFTHQKGRILGGIPLPQDKDLGLREILGDHGIISLHHGMEMSFTFIYRTKTFWLKQGISLLGSLVYQPQQLFDYRILLPELGA